MQSIPNDSAIRCIIRARLNIFNLAFILWYQVDKGWHYLLNFVKFYHIIVSFVLDQTAALHGLLIKAAGNGFASGLGRVWRQCCTNDFGLLGTATRLGLGYWLLGESSFYGLHRNGSLLGESSTYGLHRAG